MKKIIALILSAVMLTMTLAACGEEKRQDEKQENPSVNSANLSEADGELNNEADISPQGTTAEGVPYSYNGAYTDGTNYLVFDDGEVVMNGQKCEVTRVSTDLFSSGVAVVYFTYKGNEISAYCDPVCGMGCSLEQAEGSWLTYEAIDISDVPTFAEAPVDAVSATADNDVSEEPAATEAPSDNNTFLNCAPVTVTIAGDQITFPATAESLEALGWTYENYGGCGRYNKGEYHFTAYYGIEYALEGQVVSGFKVWYEDFEGTNVILNSGISFDSGYDEVFDLYGEADEIFEYEYDDTYQYKNVNGMYLSVTIDNGSFMDGTFKNKVISMLYRYE
ncbi:MAG: hypothetical protein WC900_10090 [Oscillospiraceae bacterium]|jgi:hypothetical protein